MKSLILAFAGNFFIQHSIARIFLIFSLKVLNAVAGDEFEKPVPFVIGGTDTNWGQFASSVVIDGPNEFCGGTIVESNHVRRLTSKKFFSSIYDSICKGSDCGHLLAEREL